MLRTLYHKCYYSYLKGDLKNCQIYFDFLKSEFHKTRDKKSLNQFQLKHLKKTHEALKSGSISQDSWLPDAFPADSIPDVKKYGKDQDHLVKEIYKSTDTLQALLPDVREGFKLDNVEHPCPPHGRVDMLYRDAVYAYPVEVKTALGGHDVVGQVLKYDQFFRMLLHTNFWQEVTPVTICGGYTEFALNELKKRGVVTLLHRSTKNGLKLSKV